MIASTHTFKLTSAVCLLVGLSVWTGCGENDAALDAAETSFKVADANVETSPNPVTTRTASVVVSQDRNTGDSQTADQGTDQDDDAGQDNDSGQDDTASRAEIDWDAPIEQPPEAKDMQRAAPDYEMWFDKDAKKIVLAGRVCQDNGALEFFATLRGYQEHEAIVTIKTKSSLVHAAFLAMGVNPGHPVQYRPEFKAAEGPEINVTVHWTDEQGKRKSAKAQDWVKNFETGKPLEHPFIFGGSTMVPLQNGDKYYAADDGYLICVANFPSAMLDLPITSTDSNAGLLFEAHEEKIPPIGTEVAVVLEPVAKDAKADDKDDDAEDKDKGERGASAP